MKSSPKINWKELPCNQFTPLFLLFNHVLIAMESDKSYIATYWRFIDVQSAILSSGMNLVAALDPRPNGKFYLALIVILLFIYAELTFDTLFLIYVRIRTLAPKDLHAWRSPIYNE